MSSFPRIIWNRKVMVRVFALKQRACAICRLGRLRYDVCWLGTTGAVLTCCA